MASRVELFLCHRYMRTLFCSVKLTEVVAKFNKKSWPGWLSKNWGLTDISEFRRAMPRQRPIDSCAVIGPITRLTRSHQRRDMLLAVGSELNNIGSFAAQRLIVGGDAGSGFGYAQPSGDTHTTRFDSYGCGAPTFGRGDLCAKVMHIRPIVGAIHATTVGEISDFACVSETTNRNQPSHLRAACLVRGYLRRENQGRYTRWTGRRRIGSATAPR